ncbi:MAG: AAA family ATPase, partial [Gemmatimonadaceae bacterium]
RFQEALLAAGRQATADGDTKEALAFAERLSDVAPYDEEAALFEANTLVGAGRPNQAIAALRQFSGRLNDDLDIRVPPAVRALLDRLEKRRETPKSQDAAANAGRERAKPSTFVGRDLEIARLMGALDRLKVGRGATVLLEGDAGIGKSRLLGEFADRTRNLGGVLILRGREGGIGGVVPYAAVVEALRPIVRAAGVSGASRHLLAEAARLLPELRDSFELPAVSAIEDETGRLRLFEGIAAVIDAAAYEKSVCIVLDDMQQASPSTLDLVTYLSQRLRESPVLLVLAYRPDRSAPQTIERMRELITGEQRGDDHRISLDALSPNETSDIVREELGRVGGGNLRDVDRIVTRAAGRPFAALELSRRAAQGTLANDPPVGLRDVLWARLQTASPTQRRVFFACALFDRSASLRLLAAAAHLPESAAWDATQELVRVGLLAESADGYVLAHYSAAAFLVESSGLGGRALLAGWAADALAESEPNADGELAALYAMAGRGGDAFVRARAAAFAAAAVGAAAEVVRLLGIALTFAPNEASRREIDSLLGAFGRDRLTLPSSSVAATETPEIFLEPAPAVTAVMDDAPPIDVQIVVEPALTIEPEMPREPDVVVEPLDPVEPVDQAEHRNAAVPARTRLRRATVGQWVMSIAISVIVILAGIAARRGIMTKLSRRVSPDTLFLVERDATGQNQVRAIANPIRGRNTTLLAADPGALGPAWVDSVAAPYTNPLISPDRKRVALERVTSRGGELLVVSADRRDTVFVTPPGQDNIALGWSPDGRALLVARARTLPDGSLDSDLYVCWVGTGGAVGTIAAAIPIDTSATRAIVEAKWSPTGTRVAWVARTGPTRQRDVYVGRPDGSGVQVIASNPSDDYNIDWSPDGSLLAFTSTRDGGRRLYVYDFDDRRLWPISDRSDEDDARFSPDGRTIAFESTRDGDRAIYERASLGGSPRRLTPAGRQLSIAAWRGETSAYLDRLRLVGGTSLEVGDTMSLGLLALTSGGASVSDPRVQFKVLDGNIASVDTGHGAALRVVGRAVGSGRVVASVPGWRADTLTLLVSSSQPLHLDDQFRGTTLDSRWLALGEPAPFVGVVPGSNVRGLFPNGDMEWESGALLLPALQLRAGMRVQARVFAPFSGRPSAARLNIGLVIAAAPAMIDHTAPRLNTVVGAQW